VLLTYTNRDMVMSCKEGFGKVDIKYETKWMNKCGTNGFNVDIQKFTYCGFQLHH